MKKITHKKRHAFTLIEILVVTTIIIMLTGGAIVSYSQINKQSKDAKRKADMEQLRGALELYRSNVGAYPNSLTFNCPASGALTDGTNTYLQTIPNDPSCSQGKVYIYSSASPYQTYT